MAAGAVITTELISADWRLKKEKTISCGNAIVAGSQGASTRPSMSRLPLYPGPHSEVMLSITPPTSDATMLLFCGANGGTTSVITEVCGVGAAVAVVAEARAFELVNACPS
jgi:hypothetical protein